MSETHLRAADAARAITAKPEYDAFLDEPIWGAKNIVREIKRPVAATYYLIATEVIPVTKIANRYCTTRRKLRDLFNGPPVSTTKYVPKKPRGPLKKPRRAASTTQQVEA